MRSLPGTAAQALSSRLMASLVRIGQSAYSATSGSLPYSKIASASERAGLRKRMR
jgi:hypothetical protein